MVVVHKIDTEEDLKKVFQVRLEVFVNEQKVDEDDELDEFEDTSTHFALKEGDKVVGTSRWRKTEKGYKLERFAILKEYRGKGYGADILQTTLDDVLKVRKDEYIYLNAQTYALGFYGKLGFEAKGEEFDECGIMHYEMFYNK